MRIFTPADTNPTGSELAAGARSRDGASGSALGSQGPFGGHTAAWEIRNSKCVVVFFTPFCQALISGSITFLK